MSAVSTWNSQSSYNPLATRVVHNSLGKTTKLKKQAVFVFPVYILVFFFLQIFSHHTKSFNINFNMNFNMNFSPAKSFNIVTLTWVSAS